MIYLESKNLIDSKWLADIENRKVVICGSNDAIAKYWKDCSFKDSVIGIVGAEERNYILGRKVLTFKEIDLIKPDLMIIVEEIEELYPSYIRLWENLFCEVPIYFKNGCDLRLLSKKITEMKCDYYNYSIEDLKSQIEKHEIISFDIFDTLLIRECYEESDFFEILQDKVMKVYGIKNFKEIRKRGLVESRHNPSIYDIYDKIMEILDISKGLRDKLLDMEIQLERSLIIKRTIMVNILNWSVQSGKKVYLVSDMYLPEDILRSLLKENGIEGYEKIYVSCAEGRLKKEGLFQKFSNELGIAPSQALHIGDNYVLDGFYAEIFGIDFWAVKDVKSMLKDSNYCPVIERAQNCNERSVLGLAVSHVFNDPFCLHKREGKPVVNSTYDFCFSFIGCLFLQFILWFIDEINKEKYDEILFGSRDGYLIQKLYKIAKKRLNRSDLPKGEYLLISRPLGSASTIENEEDIINILDAPYKYPINWIMENKFNIQETELLKYESNDTVESYALRHKELIYQKSKREKKNYCNYLDKIGLEEKKRYAFFDFVSRGSCQLYLKKICNLDITGVYFWHSTNRATKDMLDLPIHADWNTRNTADSASYMFHFYLLLETFVTSLSASVQKFDESGKPIYFEDMRTEKEIKFIKDAQRGITEFIDIYLQNLYIEGMDVGKALADYLYSFTNPGNTNLDFPAINNLMLVDDWMQEKVPLDR